MTETTSARRVQRVRHELKRRELSVLRVHDITPHFRRITFGGESLADFVSASFDDHVKLILPDGAMRDYTPRRFDVAARELDIEFAMHGDGPAASWAAQAQPGQGVTIGGPRGSFIVPVDFDWHLLVGDDTALPAVARRLEELPAGCHAVVRLAVAAQDRRALRSAATVDLQWFDDHAALAPAVRSLKLPEGEGYAWCAGEAASMAALRQVIVDEFGHDRHAIRAAAYWKRGAAGHHENLEDR